MPHAELKYSDDLEIDPQAIFADIEACLLRHDPGCGICKGRAYPAAIFQHSHLLVTVSLLTKPHRNADFTQALVDDLQALLKGHLRQECHLSLLVAYSPPHYVTGAHRPG